MKFIIKQNEQIYDIYHPHVGLICRVWLTNDKQYMRDSQCLTAIGRALHKRWDMGDSK